MGKATQNMSVDELRAQISQRLRSSAAFSETVYQDQPIIMTGAQLKSFTPDPIREARQLARNAYGQSKDVASVFYEQARLLAGYEDDFEFTGTFSQYYPTYEDMSNEQLRGYFAWRTQVRQGNITQGSLSFAYVYLYELINLIGVADAQEGYETLQVFGAAYRQFDKRFGQLFDAWINDFVIYYDLDAELLQDFACLENDKAFETLLRREAHSSEELFQALCQLSDYCIKESPFFLEHEKELKALIVSAYALAANHHDEKLTTTLAAKLSGKLSKKRIWLFERAVFANPLGVQSATYVISPHDTVFCRTGAWFRVRYGNLEDSVPWVSQLLETCEYYLREAYQYPNTLSQSLTTKYLTKTISKQAQEFAEEQRVRETRAVHIDFSQLDHIRSAADETCEKLIVEEENVAPVFGFHAEDADTGQVTEVNRTELEETTIEEKHAESVSIQSDEGTPIEAKCASAPSFQPDSDVSPLDSQESALLIHLLSAGSARDFERANACIASVLIDSINEKLYDEFADICIDTYGDEPQIIEDYANDLRALMGLA